MTVQGDKPSLLRQIAATEAELAEVGEHKRSSSRSSKLLVEDLRVTGTHVEVSFCGDLTDIQAEAAKALLQQDTGVLVAPPGTGKTVLGIYLLATRETNTLILVHRQPLLATGRFIGESFDDARLDTLFLALPVAWKGTLVQYAGRLHRTHPSKHEVRVVDYVDNHVPMLARMFEKRLRGYRAMGYQKSETPNNLDQELDLAGGL
jgi:superfamily II DNA or RNA helicase